MFYDYTFLAKHVRELSAKAEDAIFMNKDFDNQVMSSPTYQKGMDGVIKKKVFDDGSMMGSGQVFFFGVP